jgi:hypothetical protein
VRRFSFAQPQFSGTAFPGGIPFVRSPFFPVRPGLSLLYSHEPYFVDNRGGFRRQSSDSGFFVCLYSGSFWRRMKIGCNNPETICKVVAIGRDTSRELACAKRGEPNLLVQVR